MTLGTTEAARDAALPEVPSVTEAGYPAARGIDRIGFSAAAGIPPELASRWGAVIAEALADPRLRERCAGIGVVPGTLGAAGDRALIAAAPARWRGVIQAARINPECAWRGPARSGWNTRPGDPAAPSQTGDDAA